MYRAREWFVSKLPLLWVAYWSLPGVSHGLALWAWFTVCAVCVLAFGYAVNDLSDLSVDAAAGKARRLSAFTPQLRVVVLLVPAVAGLGAAAAFGPAGVLGQLCALLVATAYSMPPLRLKESVAWGPLAASFGQRVAPAAVCLAGGRVGLATVVALLVGLLSGLRAIYVHQLLDAASDAALGLRTAAVVLGADRVRATLYGLVVPAEVVLTVTLAGVLVGRASGVAALVVVVSAAAIGAGALVVLGVRPDSLRFRVEHGPLPGWTVQSVVLPALASILAGAAPAAVVQLALVLPRLVSRLRAALAGRAAPAAAAGDGSFPRPVARRGYVEWWYLHANAEDVHVSGSVRLSGNPDRPESLQTVIQFMVVSGGGQVLCSARAQGLDYTPGADGRLEFVVGDLTVRRSIGRETVTWALGLGRGQPEVTIEGPQAERTTIWIAGDELTGGVNWTPWLWQAAATVRLPDGRIVAGTGYQDHNWSSAPLQESVRSWRWMHVASPVPMLVTEIRLPGRRWLTPVRRSIRPDGSSSRVLRWTRERLDLAGGVSISGLETASLVSTPSRPVWWWVRVLPQRLRPGYSRRYGRARVTGASPAPMDAWHVSEEMRF